MDTQQSDGPPAGIRCPMWLASDWKRPSNRSRSVVEDLAADAGVSEAVLPAFADGADTAPDAILLLLQSEP